MRTKKQIEKRIMGLKKQLHYARLVDDISVIDYVKGKIRLLKWVLG